ncbi:NADPH-dependent F420 reductase [Streptomyces albipurpureus]|uniref:NAD(P)-binding domain-containing protein n=1 Tax=Streptomyces albipurpureus TaxID=2897419 RepID=A0ABT0UQG1_9ACTN|nr:NAD(P)-binding domain-containing protein [Streptomyces sp. CWNU-1]MCM2390601.1 NAD(P)-binding domain-containing protein [Streptomyces sp. CWNU-1]
MTTIAILGSGTVARALTGALRRAGHEVLVGSRDPRTAIRAEAGSAVRATGLWEAAGSAELVINALPGSVSVEVLAGLAKALADKVLIDIANATEIDAHGFASAAIYPGSSLAEQLQLSLPAVHVVKTLNTVHASLMGDPSQLAFPPCAFLSGNEARAKGRVAELLGELGWAREWIIDLGDIRTARGPESFVLMVGDLVRALGPVPFGMAIAR